MNKQQKKNLERDMQLADALIEIEKLKIEIEKHKTEARLFKAQLDAQGINYD